jgi:predicted ATPase
MLVELQVKNFKAWQDTGSIRLAPLTIVFGGNSSGKSSLGHLLLALKQTVQISDRKRALHLGDENSLIDLGTFTDCLHGHDLESSLEFAIKWRLTRRLHIENPLSSSEGYTGDRLSLHSTLRADKAGQPVTNEIQYTLFDGDDEILEIKHGRKGSGGYLDASPLRLVHAQGRKWPAETPEKFYRFADRTLLRYQNADFLAEFALETERILDDLYYLGPLRSPPRRVYQWSGDSPPDVGQEGESAIAAILSASAEGRNLNRGRGRKKQRFDEFIASWLVDLGIIAKFRVKAVAEGRKEYEVLVRTQENSPEVKLTDVGFGISQVLPALVQAFYCPKGSTVWMEQPEIHLHPRAQSVLADAFISATQSYEDSAPRETQLIIETHSEHLLNRLQRRVAEGAINKEDVAVYFVNNKKGTAQLEALELDEYGEILNWPENFFGDEMEDITERTLAAIKKRSNKKLGSVK